ncbi:hypothetical protein QBC42DRAFT_40481 [Cladorrhinum samala]|uniref:Secreted protein n=1 Tax=Cladorrhinum samala TaxID=585594 RepID=A0AAV9H986_9PEZI|nr:hypothetical protein QBC42DRAFT_40481 [Cladorrhinum samala]
MGFLFFSFFFRIISLVHTRDYGNVFPSLVFRYSFFYISIYTSPETKRRNGNISDLERIHKKAEGEKKSNSYFQYTTTLILEILPFGSTVLCPKYRFIDMFLPHCQK